MRLSHKYLAHKLEFLALKWAITEQFHEYLYGNHFAIYTDNNPLTSCPNQHYSGMQLVINGLLGLANHGFIMNYHSGKVNVDADALSHIPKGDYDQSIEAESVRAPLPTGGAGHHMLIEVYSCNVRVTETLDRMEDPKVMSEKEWIDCPEQGFCDKGN